MAMSAGSTRTGPVCVLDGGVAVAADPAYDCGVVDELVFGRCMIRGSVGLLVGVLTHLLVEEVEA
jgi:hypothetical protein